jgi:hydrogenase nickel incorporation protein HypB
MTPFAHEYVEGSGTETSQSSEFRPPAAAMIRKALAQAQVLSVRIIGPPGSGKTGLLESTLKRLPGPQRVAVIVIHPASARDADRLRKFCGFIAHVDAAIPAAPAIWHVLSGLNLSDFDTILIEAAGGLAPLQDLGQDTTAAVFAISGGDDKAVEYRALVQAASAILLTKTDLRPLVKFDSQVFRSDVRSISSSAEVYELCALTGTGMADWVAWLERMRVAKRRNKAHGGEAETSPSIYLG